MSNTFAPDEFPCELLLNGVPVQSVRIRQGTESASDFEILVNEPVLGVFSLQSGFEIQAHEPDGSWRGVSLDDLKGILKDKYLLPADDLPKTSEMAECRLFARVDDIRIPHWESARLSVLGREEACVRYVQRIFYRVGIPHLVTGTTFIVPSAPTARIPLKRAGFRRSTISISALFEPRTQVSIQLIEQDPAGNGLKRRL
jgi:hypothetical protein